MDRRAQAAVLADLPVSVAQEAGEYYENAGGGDPLPKHEAMAVAWEGVLRPYLIGLRDHSDAQSRPPTYGAVWCYDMGAAPRDGTKVDLMFPRPRGRVVNAFWGRSHLAGADLWVWRTPTWGRGSIDPLPEEKWDMHCYPNLKPYAWRLADEPPAP